MNSHAFIKREALFRFYAELNDFLPQRHRQCDHRIRFIGRPAVKDLIEAQQVPHTEVDLILVNGNPVSFRHSLKGGERVSVYPVFERLDIQSVNRLRPAPLRHPCFIADVHLGKLARYLRILGLDVMYQNDYEDETIIAVSQQTRRIILTRDLGILKNSRVTHGYWLRNTDPVKQLKEVVQALQLESNFKPFTRCCVCNGQLQSVRAEQIWHLIQPDTRRYYDTFYQCDACLQVFWKGSHYARILAQLMEEGIDLQVDST